MKDKNNIEMEDISAFPLERSANHHKWEEITYSELKGEVLEGLMEEKLKCFFDHLGISTSNSEMSFAVSDSFVNVEYGGKNLKSLFLGLLEGHKENWNFRKM